MPTDFWNYTASSTGGSKYFGATSKYLDQESKYFEVVGPHGGPVISEGVQILQHYSEVIGPEGPNTSKYLDRGNYFRGVHFFVTAHPLRFLLLPKKWTNPQEIDMQTRQSAVSFHLGGLLCAHLHISSWIPSALPTISN